MKDQFRFQGLTIWEKAIDIGDELFSIADQLEERKLFRFADQMRGAGLSISNNIAEGSGSISEKDFANFLNIARRSVFENANMVIVFRRRGLISSEDAGRLLGLLEEEAQMIGAFVKSLRCRHTIKNAGVAIIIAMSLALLPQLV